MDSCTNYADPIGLSSKRIRLGTADESLEANFTHTQQYPDDIAYFRQEKHTFSGMPFPAAMNDGDYPMNRHNASKIDLQRNNVMLKSDLSGDNFENFSGNQFHHPVTRFVSNRTEIFQSDALKSTFPTNNPDVTREHYDPAQAISRLHEDGSCHPIFSRIRPVLV